MPHKADSGSPLSHPPTGTEPAEHGDYPPVDNFRATAITETSVTLAWDDPGLTYDLLVERDNVEVAVLEAGSTSYTDTGLEPGTEYRYAITLIVTPPDFAFSAGLKVTTVGESTEPPYCTAHMELVTDWGSAFLANVFVTNSTTVTSEGWTVRWDWPAGQQVINSPNTDLTQSGSSVEAHDLVWNGSLDPGESAFFVLIVEPGGQELPASLECVLST